MPDAMLLVARRLTFCILQRIAQPVYNLAISPPILLIPSSIGCFQSDCSAQERMTNQSAKYVSKRGETAWLSFCWHREGALEALY